MTLRLAENIRTMRKARVLTQEQLAEVLGVTVGAVYKWEAGLSIPDVHLLMEMADFFDTSVDVLLGYELHDHRIETTVRRLKRYRDEKDAAGLQEAEKALKQYPNVFEIAYNSAAIYRLFGMEGRNPVQLSRAMTLLESARRLLPQNTNPRISESTICAEIAETMLSMGRAEEAVARLQQHNAGDFYCDLIGLTLAAECGKPDEAQPYLTRALLQSIASIIRVVTGYTNVYFSRKDYCGAAEILQWGTQTLSSLSSGERVSFLDKIDAALLACLAAAQVKNGNAELARQSLMRARAMAERFDENPDYHVTALRFIASGEQAGVYDDLGTSALESVERMLASMEDAALDALWREVSGHTDENA